MLSLNPFCVHLKLSQHCLLTGYTTVCVCVCVCVCVICLAVSNSTIPWTVAHQAPLSMEFSRQEHWSR